MNNLNGIPNAEERDTDLSEALSNGTSETPPINPTYVATQSPANKVITSKSSEPVKPISPVKNPIPKGVPYLNYRDTGFWLDEFNSAKK